MNEIGDPANTQPPCYVCTWHTKTMGLTTRKADKSGQTPAKCVHLILLVPLRHLLVVHLSPALSL